MKRYKIFWVLLICILMISLTSCQKEISFDFVPAESDVALMLQWRINTERTGVCFVVRDNRIFAISCDTSEYQSYDNYLPNLSIHKYMGSHKMTREEQNTVYRYLEQIKNIEGDKFSNGTKDSAFLVLHYNGHVFTSKVQTELFIPEAPPHPDKYEEGYYVLNEFTKYVCTLMPEAFDNFPK